MTKYSWKQESVTSLSSEFGTFEEVLQGHEIHVTDARKALVHQGPEALKRKSSDICCDNTPTKPVRIRANKTLFT
jgi:hypothetical protein